MLRLASWNVNGIRAVQKKGFVDWVRASSFDVIGLQEVRAEPHQIPSDVLELEGYNKLWFSAAAKKGYSGTGILSKVHPLKVWNGMGHPESDDEGRVLTAEFKDLVFVTAYFPNSQDGGKRIDFKIRFCKNIHEYVNGLRASCKKPVVLCGDFNIAHQPIDLARPDDNHESPGYLPQEREWMGQFLEAGWVDTFRTLHPSEKDRYSWWSMRTRARERNIGWRIDYHTVHEGDWSRVHKADICENIEGSDHCPVTLDIDATL